MLTKNDLKQIQNLFEGRLARIDKQIGQFQQEFRSEITTVKKNIGKLQKDVSGLKEKLDIVSKTLDYDHIQLTKRVQRVEDFLKPSVKQ